MINIMLRYLGIKTKLLEPIKIAIDNVTPQKGSVIDLFGGSNTVAQSLINDYTVYTNDYQAYSYIAAKALIEYHSTNVINSLTLEKVFGKYYKENKAELTKRFSTPLAAEKKFLDDIGDLYYGPTFDKFTDYFDHSAYAGHPENSHPVFNSCISYYSSAEIQKYRENSKLFPYSLFTLYYGNPYFSIHQCVEIDSINYSIDKLLESGEITDEEHSIYLSFLIYCLNLIVISVGDHFAQPQKIKPVKPDLSGERDSINLRERKKIIGKKRTLVQQLYREKFEEYKANYKAGNIANKAFNLDYKILLSDPAFKALNINTAYIDPPYTNAHYSRFYHIPETLVKYDYPEIEYFGRYRTDRYHSGFCIKSQALEEFRTLLRLCKENSLHAVISYSDTAQCILPIEDITSVCQEYYHNNVLIENVAHMYRNFGQKPNRVLAKEYIITCKHKE